MTLSAGTKLGSYEITGAIGAGGMGEVYRARDAKLGRYVALKVLPEAFARDAERMARFQREAKVLASLNHPNIASIYGLEDSGATHALVMELVEGPTLADRINSGPIPISEALPIAKQMCDALEYAHERGIVHRDLKPANVKVTSDDAVKILDFGLAKALQGDSTPAESVHVSDLLHRMENLLEGDSQATDIANSPTVSEIMTRPGILLGTAAYMSPEQAKGKAVDRRADIWSFGCVLYEMLTGKMAFHGESVTDTLAAVIKEEPDWSQLPTAAPIRVRVLLQRCLQKDPKQRLRDIGDARISVDEVLSGAPDPTSAGSAARVRTRARSWIVGGLTALMSVLALCFAFLYFHKKPPATTAVRFDFSLPEELTGTGISVISPDGSKLVFIATGTDGVTRLWMRSLDALQIQALEGTEGIYGYPFWSPDNRFIVFFAQGKVKKTAASGGPPITLCDASVVWGGAWKGETIIFGTNEGTMQMNASGGSPGLITDGGFSVTPSFLPDGRHFVYLRNVVEHGRRTFGIYLGSVDTKPGDQPSRPLLPDFTFVAFAPSFSDPRLGYLLFVRGTTAVGTVGTLMAQPFDTSRLELAGDAIPLAERVSNTSLSASGTGVLVYVAGEQQIPDSVVKGNIRGKLTWFDRQGKILRTAGDPTLYRTLSLSPDGKRVALEAPSPQDFDVTNIWLYEFGRGIRTRFTFDSGWDTSPIWSPDGSQIAFASSRNGNGLFDLYLKPSNLADDDQLLFKSSESKIVSSWSRDGRLLFYGEAGKTSHLWLLPLSGGTERKPVEIEQTRFNEAMGRFSPDGRWIVYSSDESGKDEIYVRPFEVTSVAGSSADGKPVAGKWMVSKDGGTSPLWRGDGREIFFLSPDGMATAVDISTSGGFQAGTPKPLFKVPTGVLFWDVSADGKRFLMPAPSTSNVQRPFTLVLNWQAGLSK
ncbi:MAG: protein kinase [Candidatus Acidiferrales bacterium]|jgi:serine/threonine protein kinase